MAEADGLACWADEWKAGFWTARMSSWNSGRRASISASMRARAAWSLSQAGVRTGSVLACSRLRGRGREGSGQHTASFV